jgi:hypothetical protein
MRQVPARFQMRMHEVKVASSRPRDGISQALKTIPFSFLPSANDPPD